MKKIFYNLKKINLTLLSIILGCSSLSSSICAADNSYANENEGGDDHGVGAARKEAMFNKAAGETLAEATAAAEAPQVILQDASSSSTGASTTAELSEKAAEPVIDGEAEARSTRILAGETSESDSQQGIVPEEIAINPSLKSAAAEGPTSPSATKTLLEPTAIKQRLDGLANSLFSLQGKGSSEATPEAADAAAELPKVILKNAPSSAPPPPTGTGTTSPSATADSSKKAAENVTQQTSWAIKSTADIITNSLSDILSAQNSSISASSDSSSSHSLWFQGLGARGEEFYDDNKKDGYKLTSAGFIAGYNYKFTDSFLLGVFGGKNFSEIADASKEKVKNNTDILFGGLYSKINLFSNLDLEIKGGMLHVNLKGEDESGNETKFKDPVNTYFADARVNYNLAIVSDINLGATLGFKILQSDEYEYETTNKESFEVKGKNNKFFLAGANISKKFELNEFALQPKLHIFKEFALDKNPTILDIKDSAATNIADEFYVDNSQLTAGGLISLQYNNSALDIGADYIISSNKFSGFVGRLKLQINL